VKRDLIIQSVPRGLNIVLLEDDKIVEYHQEESTREYVIGDIYLGVVKKIMPSLNAAFVDIGYEKQAFLHYHDLGPNFANFKKYTDKILHKSIRTSNISEENKLNHIRKNGNIGDLLEPGDKIVVQLIKEPISTKGHRISTEITLPGRYVILIPFGDSVNISRRIRLKPERKRLGKLFSEILSKNFGVIVRTATENVQAPIILDDFEKLMKRWDTIVDSLLQDKKKLLGEYNKSTSILRDMLNNTFSSIVVDDNNTYEEIKKYIREALPDLKISIKLYTGKIPLFEEYNIDRQLKSSFGKIVNFGKGAYLIIEHTEAMHVIDVNSGSKNTKESNREDSVLNVNLEAAQEICRQMRLRDLGGIIVVDFIDMRVHENQKILFEKMKAFLKNDRTQSSLLPISRFGLMEITRQRVKPEIHLSITETCPVCKGSGQVKPSILVIDDIDHSLNYIGSEMNVKSITIKVHPFVNKYLKSGFPSLRLQWILKYKIFIRIQASEAMHIIDYQILDKNGKDLEEF
jgi:ribonuclease G